MLLTRWKDDGQNESDLRAKTRLWKCKVSDYGIGWRDDEPKKRDVANKRRRGRRAVKSVSVRENHSTEKWKIEDAPTAKEIAARIWRVENDISKNPERMMSKNTQLKRRDTKRCGKMCGKLSAKAREKKTREHKELRGKLVGAHLTLQHDFPFEQDFYVSWIKLNRSVIDGTKCGMRIRNKG